MKGHGTAPEPQTVYSGETVNRPTPDPTATGYDFRGWVKGDHYFTFEKPINDDVTIYAYWVPLSNTISFDLGKNGVTIPDQTLTSGQTVTEPEVMFIDNEGIEGWYTDPERTQKYDFSTPVDHEITLYAKWAPAGLASFNVTNPNGGTVTISDAKGFTYNDGFVMPGKYTLAITPNNGYTFSGSYTLSERGSGSSKDYNLSGSTTVYELDLTNHDLTGNITFTNEPVVTISVTDDGSAWGTYTLQDKQGRIYYNGNVLERINNTIDWNSAYDLVLTIHKDKGTYSCEGTIVNNGVTTAITNDKTVYEFTPTGSVNVELFFYDPAKTYTISFDTGEGGTAITPITQAYGTAVTAPADPTRTGYTFMEWDKAIPETMPAMDLVITALWKKQITVTANSDTKTYNGKPLTNDGYTATPLDDGDSFQSVTVTGSQTTVGTSTNVASGAQIRNTMGEDVTDKYELYYTDGTLEVTPQNVTVRADDLTKEAGEADPTLTATVTGIVEGDEASLISYTISRAEGEEPGTYAITPSGAPSQGNYAVTFVAGTLTINGSTSVSEYFKAGMSTYYSDKNLALDGTHDQLKFYTVTGVSGTTVELTEIAHKQFAANTPLIVSNTSDETINVTFTEGNTEELAAQMAASMASDLGSKQVYSGFKGTAVDMTALTMSADKLYYGFTGHDFALITTNEDVYAHRCWLEMDKNTPGLSDAPKLVIRNSSGMELFYVSVAEGYQAHAASFAVSWIDPIDQSVIDVTEYFAESNLAGIPAGTKASVKITPAEGYKVDAVSGTTWIRTVDMRAPRRSSDDSPQLGVAVEVKDEGNGLWTFTMPEANVMLDVTYSELPQEPQTKTVEDTWITIADGTYTYTGQPIKPEVTVTDNGTDVSTSFTIEYSDNTDAGQATVTVKANSDQTAYTGTASKHFTIAQKPVKVTGGLTVTQKTENGKTSYIVDCTGATIEGICGTDKLGIEGITADLADNKVTLDYSNATLTGDDAANYVLDATNSVQTVEVSKTIIISTTSETNADGSVTKETTETTIDENGNEVTVITEETTDPDGSQTTTTKTIETTIEENGNEVTVINEVTTDPDGSQTTTTTETVFNPQDGSKIVNITKTDQYGRGFYNYSKTTYPNEDYLENLIEMNADGIVVHSIDAYRKTDENNTVTEERTEVIDGSTTTTMSSWRLDGSGSDSQSRKDAEGNWETQTVTKAAGGTITDVTNEQSLRTGVDSYVVNGASFSPLIDSQQDILSGVSDLPLAVSDNDKYNVSLIQHSAFDGGQQIQSVCLSTAVQSIGQFAFSNVKQLAYLILTFNGGVTGRLTVNCKDCFEGARRRAAGNDEEIEIVSGQKYEIQHDGVIVINFQTGDEPLIITSIKVTEPDDPSAIRLVQQEADGNDSWYDLQGRKLNGAPTAKGLYIRNGQKVAKD